MLSQAMGLFKRNAAPTAAAEAAGMSGTGHGRHQQHTKEDDARPSSTSDSRAPAAWGAQVCDWSYGLGSWKQLGLSM
jgi:hypothetical protein